MVRKMRKVQLLGERVLIGGKRSLEAGVGIRIRMTKKI